MMMVMAVHRMDRASSRRCWRALQLARNAVKQIKAFGPPVSDAIGPIPGSTRMVCWIHAAEGALNYPNRIS
jgi:hypothetical protein